MDITVIDKSIKEKVEKFNVGIVKTNGINNNEVEDKFLKINNLHHNISKYLKMELAIGKIDLYQYKLIKKAYNVLNKKINDKYESRSSDTMYIIKGFDLYESIDDLLFNLIRGTLVSVKPEIAANANAKRRAAFNIFEDVYDILSRSEYIRVSDMERIIDKINEM